jgi:hypothetical protein
MPLISVLEQLVTGYIQLLCYSFWDVAVYNGHVLVSVPKLLYLPMGYLKRIVAIS